VNQVVFRIELMAIDNTSSKPKSIPDIYTLWGIAFPRFFSYSLYQKESLVDLTG
jgi:hypothetical protein